VDWLAHPIVVATYVAGLGLVISAIRATARLFTRVGGVEHGVDRLEEKVDELAVDLRAHMAEEGKNIEHLENLIRSVHPDKE
jgi:hypothetical protein